MAVMKRLQLGIIGDEGTEGCAEKLVARRGANVLVLGDPVGRAAAIGSLKAERVLCFDFGNVASGFSELSVRCSS